MRIALFTETYLPQINGVVTHVKTLKDGLERLGHEVMVVTADSSTSRHYLQGDVLYCPATRLKRLYNYCAALPISNTRLRYIRRFNPDVIHIHTEFGVGISGVVAAKILHKPLVYTLHTMYDEYIYYIVPNSMVWATTKFSHRYIKFIANRAQALTGPSEKCTRYFESVGITGRPVHVVPNAVELDTFNPQNANPEKTAQIRRELGYSPEDMVICFVGRLGKEKSVDVLLEAWAENIRPEERIRLLVIGGGPFYEPYRELAQKLGIREMVTFTGAVPHDQLPPYYAACDAYATASLSDTCSISMLEGMATGLPVFQRKDPINADQVRDGVNGFNFESGRQLADQLRAFRAMDPAEKEALRASVIQSVRESGAERLAGCLVEIYQNVLAGKK